MKFTFNLNKKEFNMKKEFSMIIALLALLAVIPSYSQDGTFKFGVRAGFNLYNVYWEGKPPGIGMGYAGGLIANIPIVNSLTFNPELNFLYRNLYNHEMSYGTKESITEFALEVPIMIRFMPISQVPFYLAGGVQLSFPFFSELTQEKMGNKETRDYDDRSIVDFGIALGLGYYITGNFAVDLRGVFNFIDLSTKLNDIGPQMPPLPVNPFKRDKAWLLQYCLGVSYFF